MNVGRIPEAWDCFAGLVVERAIVRILTQDVQGGPKLVNVGGIPQAASLVVEHVIAETTITSARNGEDGASATIIEIGWQGTASSVAKRVTSSDCDPTVTCNGHSLTE